LLKMGMKVDERVVFVMSVWIRFGIWKVIVNVLIGLVVLKK